MPFKGSTVAALKHSILDGKFEIPENLSESCMELIRGILRRKPEWRLNMNQVSWDFPSLIDTFDM